LCCARCHRDRQHEKYDILDIAEAKEEVLKAAQGAQAQAKVLSAASLVLVATSLLLGICVCVAAFGARWGITGLPQRSDPSPPVRPAAEDVTPITLPVVSPASSSPLPPAVPTMPMLAVASSMPATTAATLVSTTRTMAPLARKISTVATSTAPVLQSVAAESVSTKSTRRGAIGAASPAIGVQKSHRRSVAAGGAATGGATAKSAAADSEYVPVAPLPAPPVVRQTRSLPTTSVADTMRAASDSEYVPVAPLPVALDRHRPNSSFRGADRRDAVVSSTQAPLAGVGSVEGEATGKAAGHENDPRTDMRVVRAVQHGVAGVEADRAKNLTAQYLECRGRNDLPGLQRFFGRNTRMHVNLDRAGVLLSLIVKARTATDMVGAEEAAGYFKAFPVESNDVMPGPNEVRCQGTTCKVHSQVSRLVIGDVTDEGVFTWNVLQSKLTRIEVRLSGR